MAGSKQIKPATQVVFVYRAWRPLNTSGNDPKTRSSRNRRSRSRRSRASRNRSRRTGNRRRSDNRRNPARRPYRRAEAVRSLC
jgi:hypothetical protein